MDSELTHYEIKSNAIINHDNASIFSSGGAEPRQQQYNTSSSSTSISLTTPLMGTSAESQVMSNYISSSNNDLPNQYNIIIDAEDDETCGGPLTSPSSPPLAPATVPYRSYTVQFKLDALDWYYKNGENKNLTAKMFSIDRKRIRDWLQDEPNLRSDPTPERTKRKRSNSLPQYKEIEAALYQYYCEQREKGLKPKNAELRAKSLEFASELGYRESFKASVHWLCNWKRRNKISVIQSEPSNEEDEEGVIATASGITEEQLSELSGLSQNVKGSLGDILGESSVSLTRMSGRSHNSVDGVGLRLGNHTQTLKSQDKVNDVHSHHVTRPEMSTHNNVDQATCEQWVDLVEQTVLALETDVNKKLNQIKLLLQQIKSSLHPPNKSLTSAQFHSSSSSSSAPHTKHNSITPHFPHTTAAVPPNQHNSLSPHFPHTSSIATPTQHNSITPHFPNNSTAAVPPNQHNSMTPHFPHSSPPLSLAPRNQLNKH